MEIASVITRILACIASMKVNGLNETEVMVLLKIHHDSIMDRANNQTSLSACLDVSHATISAAVTTLRRLKYVQRLKDRRLRTTEKGVAALEPVLERFKTIAAQCYEEVRKGKAA